MSASVFSFIIMILQTYLPVFFEHRAQVNLASDYAECSAYYALSAEVVNRTENKDEQSSEKLREASEIANNLAVAFSNKDVARARFLQALEKHKELIKNDLSNFEILNQKFDKS